MPANSPTEFASLPIEEHITLDVMDTLAKVTTANGFNVTLAEIRRGDTKDERAPEDLVAVLWESDPEPVADNDTPEDTTPLGFQQWRKSYYVLVYLLKTPDDQTPWEQWRAVVGADVLKSLLVEAGNVVENTRTRNNYANDTYARGARAFTDANDLRGVMVEIEVWFRHAEANPYSKS